MNKFDALNIPGHVVLTNAQMTDLLRAVYEAGADSINQRNMFKPLNTTARNKACKQILQDKLADPLRGLYK